MKLKTPQRSFLVWQQGGVASGDEVWKKCHQGKFSQQQQQPNLLTVVSYSQVTALL